jgi:hypothetical protein
MMIHWHVQSDPRGQESGDKEQGTGNRGQKLLLGAVCRFAAVALLLFSTLPAAAADRWGFIICGHPGDEDHRKQFADSADRIRKTLVGRFGFPASNVWIRFGVDGKDDKTLEASRGPATKEALASDAAELQKLLRQDDELWVFVIGHAHHADRTVQLNVPGPDVGVAEFARWFADVPCRRTVFFMTTPLSGYFLKPLARPGRVVATATEPDLEVNETLFHSSLAKLVETFPEGSDHDIDKDGVYSLLDLYLATALDVAKRYADETLLATEHAQLDDNGDGRGSELQLDYVAADDSNPAPPKRANQTRIESDGAIARSIDLGALVRKQSKTTAKQ